MIILTGGLNTKDHRKLGVAGELRVASELLLRGFSPSSNFLDEGADLTLENGLRLQVKSSRLTSKPDHYLFNFKSWKAHESRSKGVRLQLASDLKGIDYVILWGVDTDVFYIIPADLVRGKMTINIVIHRCRRRPDAIDYTSYVNQWDLLRR